MSRPSRQLDARLIASGLALLPETGCAGLSVRRLAEHAGVNLGMFHYHFKNKDTFVRAVLQQVYEEMFGALALQTAAEGDPLARLRAALALLGNFARTHRRLLFMLVSEALQGQAVPAAFLRDNLPRHIAVVAGLLAEGQRGGQVIDAPVPMLLPFLIGAVAAPLLPGAALESQLPQPAADALVSGQALDLRIALALRAISLKPEEFRP